MTPAPDADLRRTDRSSFPWGRHPSREAPLTGMPHETCSWWVEQIPAVVYVWGRTEDGSSDVRSYADLYVSPQIEEVLGYTPREWMQRPDLWIERLHPDDRDAVVAESQRCVEAGRPFSMDYRVVTRDRRVVWLHDTASVVERDANGHATVLHGILLDVTGRKEAEDAHRESQEQVRRLDDERRRLLESLVTAQEAERRRIAGEVHDDSVQIMTAVGLRFDVLAGGLPAPYSEDAEKLRSEIHEAMNRLRNLMFALHPPVLDTSGLRPALSMLVDDLNRSGRATTYRLEGRLRREPGGSIRTVLYRIAQEAIANTRKHAMAAEVVVSIEDVDGGFLLRVSDDGLGFDPETVASGLPGHLGVVTMRERAELAGGRLALETAPGAGTTVECWLPGDDAAV